ncbi:MAG TPA: hypothetical protein VJ874_06310 [Candidatus Thermoplasmatota archaeon]|nr:hypothetical protein [Candidatus Thermoplasmatota archaeon]
MAGPRLLVLLLPAMAALVVPVQAAPPPDAFCVILIEGAEDYGVVRVLVDLETNLTQREALFAGIDADSDGAVTPVEQERFRLGTMRVWENSTAMGLKGLQMAASDGVQQWGATVKYATTWTQVGHTFHRQDHTQPSTVTEPIDLETQEVREFHFDHVGTPTFVRLSGGRDPANETSTTGPATTDHSSSQSTTYHVVVEYVVVRAADGWTIGAIQGQSYADEVFVQPGVAEYDLPAFDTKKPFSLEFLLEPGQASDPTGGDGTVTVRETVTVTRPAEGRGAAGLPLALAALGMAGALLVRRRL